MQTNSLLPTEPQSQPLILSTPPQHSPPPLTLIIHSMKLFTQNFQYLQKGNKSEIVLYDKTLVLKMVDPAHRKQVANLMNEFTLMRGINHPNILKVFRIAHNVPLQNYDCEGESLVRDIMVMEYANRGALIGVLNKGLAMGEKKSIAMQLLNAMYYLHVKEGIAHRDIKLDNILVRQREDGRMVAMISDFGFAVRREGEIEGKENVKGSGDSLGKSNNQTQSSQSSTDGKTHTNPMLKSPKPFLASSMKGTKRLYMPPQIHSLTKYSQYDPLKADIFSFGVVLFCIFFNKIPFQYSIESKDPLFKLISQGKYSEFWDKMEINKGNNPDLPLEDLKQLLQHMLCADPAERVTMQGVFSFPFVQYLKAATSNPKSKPTQSSHPLTGNQK